MKIKKFTIKSHHQHGFALISTILVMSLLMLISVALLSISSVETRNSGVNNAQLQAQANAKMGLQIAIGQLQASLGPDARATSYASVLDTDPSTSKIDGVRNPHWLGAYPTINAAKPDDNLLLPREFRDWSLSKMKWLVSNNSINPLDPTQPLSGDTVTLGQYITDPTVTIPSGSGIDSLPASLLSKAEAGLVKVDNNSGSYAWLVSDESMKARIDTLASSDGSDILDGSVVDAIAQKNTNYQIAQGNNFSNQLPSYRDNPLSLLKLITHNELELLGASSTDSSWKSWSRLNQDKFTPYSHSLSVDVINGRLKKDLTAYFKGSYTGLDNQSMIDPRFQITNAETPSFDLLKQWATMVKNHSTPQSVTPSNTSSTTPQHGLHPVITQGAVAMQHSYKILNPTTKTFQPVCIFMPQIQLWNPHNVPLEAQDYIVQVGYQFRWWMQVNGIRNTDKATFANGNPEIRSWEELKGQPPLPIHKPADNEKIEYQTNKRFFTFVIRGQAFKAGESLLFHAKPPSSGPISGSPYNLNNDADTDILNNYTNDQDLNLLVNEGNLDEFFYIVMPMTGTLTSNGNLATQIRTESNFLSNTNGAGVGEEDLDMHLNLYAVKDDKPTLLHAMKKPQRNTRYGNWQRPTYPLGRYQSGEIFASATFDGKSPLINFGSSMLTNNFDIFAGGANMNLPPKAGQPHAVLGYWNIRNQESFSTSTDWDSGSIEATSWLNTFSFRDTPGFLSTWESTDNLYGQLSTDRLGGWHQSQVHNMAYPLFDYPSNPYGPLSLGSFQHANLSVYSWQPTYAFANAQAPPRFDRSTTKSTSEDDLYDISYLLNASTWDSYLLSTIPQSGVTLENGMRLPNSRQSLTNTSGKNALDPSQVTNEKGFDLAASSLKIHGGFNVNSTSVTAWQAFLSGTLGHRVETIHNTTNSHVKTAAAMGRFLAPLVEEPDDVAADRNGTNFASPNSWAASRTLNTEEIETLSKRIVEEVKRRGPFLSLSDFVNRRLEPDSDITGDERVYQQVLGTLQAAINKATLEDQKINHHYYNNETTVGTKMTIKPAQDWNVFNVSDIAQEAMFGMPKSKISSSGGLIHSYAPNYLSQADILTKIGPSITVRGDTFVIRSYGDSLDSTGKIVAKAWCEAVVQRSVKPVNWDGSDKKLIQPQTPNQAGFGRSFRMVSFRWLSEKDVMPFTDDESISND